ncbi:biopolymer transporter ExbD [Microcoleus sp. FACHB-831]|uniref:ExbD/TolR family protein n=1 Tax=Microcoleus sp. FACHB-831 TaxID=2692827 RepID=UPI00168287AC|nr:biopolymer transporter ExbD [Microcoleus sp. FACHB-831]MBD1922115.1 biopolymer transporter ExbD [Microcoleus sp. FACHB-831]
MKINLDTPSDDARIEIIPLIDVIFCILTFFLLASLQLTRQQAINVDLPKASTGTAQTRDILMVSFDEFGQVYIEQQQIKSREELSQALENYHIAKPNATMVLYASQNARYSEVVQLLDLMRSVGGDRVALATLPNSAGTAPVTNTPGSPIPGAAPTITPSPGSVPVDPSNPSLNSPLPYNPSQPLPGQPGVYPTVPENLPLTPVVPTPNATVTPKR